MCLPTEDNLPPLKCTHPNRIRSPPQDDYFDLVAMSDGLGRFDTVPIMGTLDQWEQDLAIAADSPSGTHTHSDHVLAMLVSQAACYCSEQLLYYNIISCMLQILHTHGPKMLRNKKKIGGSYYYHLCEMLAEPDNTAAAATFLMIVSVGKMPELTVMSNPWGGNIMRPKQLALWKLFHDLLTISDEELDETIESWTRSANHWSLAMIDVKLAHKKLQEDFPLYLTGCQIYESEGDKDKVQNFVQECLRAGDDRDALCSEQMLALRAEAHQIQMRISLTVSSPAAVKKMTPYDLDLIKFYYVALGQICTNGNVVHALVAWKYRRHESMKKFRDLATERAYKDAMMQQLVGHIDNANEQSSSDSESPIVSSPTLSSVTSVSTKGNAKEGSTGFSDHEGLKMND
ncbi:hypothetical protein TWF694_003318 [Orbilia ellipsospora]|uniref:Uncharacterized protein n=1 Tax=Orbilia ellipsospora TaxID=2528407 RepID=A0AAV9X1I8_9PEZI